MTIQALLLDHDGVLAHLDYRAAAAFFGRHLPISLQELVRHWNEWVAREGQRGYVRWERFWDSLSDTLRLPEAVLGELKGFNYLDLFQPFPDTRPALVEARQRGLRIAVLSNTPLVDLWEPLRHLGLADLVDVALNPLATGHPKPAAQAYLRALEQLEVEPAACLFFDDERSHVLGAAAVGLRGYQVVRQRQEHALHEHVVRDLSALPLLLSP